MFDILSKRRNVVKLYRRINGTPTLIKTIRLKTLNDNVVKYDNKSYVIELEHPTEVIGKSCYYYKNVDSGSSQNIKDIKPKTDELQDEEDSFNPKTLSLLLERNFIKGITSGIGEKGLSIETKSFIMGGIVIGSIIAVIFLFLSIYGVI